jgi:hypothetical protein
MRFELTRAEPKGLAVPRLNHSATSSLPMAGDSLAATRVQIDLNFTYYIDSE